VTINSKPTGSVFGLDLSVCLKVIPRNRKEVSRRFERNCFLYLRERAISPQKKEAAVFSEISVIFYETARSVILEDINLHEDHFENLKSLKII
jgi:hypothetical protein